MIFQRIFCIEHLKLLFRTLNTSGMVLFLLFPGVARYRKNTFLYGVLEFLAYGLRRFLRGQFSLNGPFLRGFLRRGFIAILGQFLSLKGTQTSSFPENNRQLVQK